MNAKELKEKLAKVPDDYELVEDRPVYGLALNHKRKEFTTTEFPMIHPKMIEIAETFKNKLELI